MKKLEVAVTLKSIKKIEEVFREMELSFHFHTVKAEKKKYGIYSVLVPNEIVDELIDKISNMIDLRLKENTISLFNADGYVSHTLTD